METSEILNSKSVKGLIKGSFVMIGMLVVLSFGFAALALFSGGNNESKPILLVYLLTLSPLTIFVGFLCLMRECYEKICVAISDENDKRRKHELTLNFLKAQIAGQSSGDAVVNEDGGKNT